MLRKKLRLQMENIEQASTVPGALSSGLFPDPPWMKFFEIERDLNVSLAALQCPTDIEYIYNPVDYAASLHCAYLRRYLSGSQKVIFIGMNPGPHGMAQTGVPFGNVHTVRDVMGLSGAVQPSIITHPKRPIHGLDYKVEERSGVRLWELFERLAGGNLDTFFNQCFVHNFCPLVFYSGTGVSITPSELKGTYKQQIRDLCLDALEKQLNLLQPQVVVAVGRYVETVLKRSSYCESKTVLSMPHPSPRATTGNWAEKAQACLEQSDLIKFIRNDV